MKRMIIFFIVAIMCVLLQACKRDGITEKKNDISCTPSHEIQGEKEEIVVFPTIYPASKSVTWSYFFYPGISETNRNEINRILYERGMDCQIRFVSSGMATDLEYEQLIAEYEKTEPLDIINSSIWMIGDRNGLSFLKKRMIPLNEYLESDSSQKAKNAYTENEWRQVTFDGDVLLFPCAAYMGSDIGIDTGVYVSINEDYIDYFTNFDGTYSSLKSIYKDIGESNLHIAISGLSQMHLYGLLGYSTVYGLPYDMSKDMVVDINENDDSLRNLMGELYADMISGILINQSMSSKSSENILAYIHLSRSDSRDGYREFLVAPSLYEASFGAKYGISVNSKQKELSYQILSFCLSDPEILSLLFPGVDKTLLERRVSVLQDVPISKLAGICFDLTGEQAESLDRLDYAYNHLWNSMYYRDENGILQLDYEWDDEKAWTEYVSNIHGCSEVYNTINEQIQKWLQKR